MDQYLEIAIGAALAGAKVIESAFEKRIFYKTKGSTSEIVSKYDRLSEKAIVKYIDKHCKNSSFILEEGGTRLKKSPGPLWLIDPIDGTTNFVRNIPLFAISIACAINEEIVVGVIYHPITKELYTTIRGKGAYLNDRKITVTKNKKLKELIIATRFPTDPSKDQLTFKFLKTLFDQGIRVRDFGTSALEMAYLAAGRIDGFWISRPKSWDIAAGTLLVLEAGGSIEFERTILAPKNFMARSASLKSLNIY